MIFKNIYYIKEHDHYTVDIIIGSKGYKRLIKSMNGMWYDVSTEGLDFCLDKEFQDSINKLYKQYNRTLKLKRINKLC